MLLRDGVEVVIVWTTKETGESSGCSAVEKGFAAEKTSTRGRSGRKRDVPLTVLDEEDTEIRTLRETGSEDTASSAFEGDEMN